MKINFEDIRKENIRKYGEDTWYEDLLSNMYSDQTHFILELLQNAEDVFATEISFELFEDRLEITHNGTKLFNEEDVRGICGLAKGAKRHDLTKIGKFGLGFKSVYAYTSAPYIYSGEVCFKIEKFVRPYEIVPLEGLTKNLTKFILPFKEDIKDKAYNEIKSKISSLDLTTTLFLKSIQKIKWRYGDTWGEYLRDPLTNEKFEIKQLISKNMGITKSQQEWIIFRKPIEIIENKKLFVEMAFLVKLGTENKITQFLQYDRSELFVFFQTQKETHLKFLIQGPYRTTHNRENIPPNDDWNKKLINQTAELVQEFLDKLKEEKLLDVSTLQIFPIERNLFNESNMFFPIYTSVKEKLTNGAFLPSSTGEYINTESALLARTKDLRDLLNTSQLSDLFSKNDVKWLNPDITADKTQTLRDYLMEELKIEEVTPEKFASLFNEEFIRKQSDEWIIQFYKFLFNLPALTRARNRGEKEGILRSKPIIRLEDNSHISAFDEQDEVLVFLPSGNSYDSFFKIVKKEVCEESQAREFLRNLGLKEPNKIAGVRKYIIPKYQNKKYISEPEHLKDIEYIKKTILSDNSEEVKELIAELKSLEFLYGFNKFSKKRLLKSSEDLYLGRDYTESDSLETFFDDNPEVFFLDKIYLGLLNRNILIKLGCMDRVKVYYREPNWEGHIRLYSDFGYHERGLDGFDPDCDIDGLTFAIDNINLSISLILWEYLRKYHNSIRGAIESSKRQDFSRSSKEEKFSKMGFILFHSAWLFGKDNKPYKPSEILLSDLHDSYNKENDEVILISKKILKQPIEEELFSYLPEKEHERVKLALEISKLYSPQELEELKRRKESLYKEHSQGESKRYMEALASTTSPDMAKNSIDGVSYPTISHDTRSDDEKDTQAEEDIDDSIKKTIKEKIRTISININEASLTDDEIKHKLIQEYDGKCQVCFERIVNNYGNPSLNLHRLVLPSQNDKGISDESNCLILCPNCDRRLQEGFPWAFIKGETAMDQPDFEGIKTIEREDKTFQALSVFINGKKQSIHYHEGHISKFKYLCNNY